MERDFSIYVIDYDFSKLTLKTPKTQEDVDRCVSELKFYGVMCNLFDCEIKAQASQVRALAEENLKKFESVYTSSFLSTTMRKAYADMMAKQRLIIKLAKAKEFELSFIEYPVNMFGIYDPYVKKNNKR